MNKINQLLCIVLMSITLPSIMNAQQYLDYSEILDGVYEGAFEGGPAYSTITIKNSTNIAGFIVERSNSYIDGGERVVENTTGSVIIGGPDGDETFVQFENEETAYSIWFEWKDGDVLCFIAFDYESPVKHTKKEPIDISDINSGDVARTEEISLPEYIQTYNWHENFQGKCYISDRGGVLKIDGDGADRFIGLIEIFNEGYDENGDDQYDGENEEAPYMTEIYIQGTSGTNGELNVSIWTKHDVDLYEYSEQTIKKSESSILIEDIEYMLSDCYE